jgi:hypothetical protein
MRTIFLRSGKVVTLAACGALLTLAACSSSSDSSPAAADASQDTSVLGEASTDAARPVDAGADGAVDSGNDAGCDPDSDTPSDLSCTGLYSDLAAKTVASGVMAYTPAYLLWSDGAQKSRWIYLPPGAQIDTSNMDDWTFPVGTKVWKEFRWPASAGDAGSPEAGAMAGKRIETRLLWKKDSGWDVLVYRWSADETSAVVFLNGATNLEGTTYEIPSTSECYQCHQGRQDFLLGFDLVGVGASGAVGVTLASLVDAGLLTSAPPASTIHVPEDTTGLAANALGFLHMNCGVTCHNGDDNAAALATGLRFKLLADQMYPDGGAGTVASLDTYQTAVNVPAHLQPNGVQYMRIAPGDAGQSLVPLMALARDPDAGGFEPMPPIVSHEPDPADIAKVQAWINAL